MKTDAQLLKSIKKTSITLLKKSELPLVGGGRSPKQFFKDISESVGKLFGGADKSIKEAGKTVKEIGDSFKKGQKEGEL